MLHVITLKPQHELHGTHLEQGRPLQYAVHSSKVNHPCARQVATMQVSLLQSEGGRSLG